jgi:hypothetical protein
VKCETAAITPLLPAPVGRLNKHEVLVLGSYKYFKAVFIPAFWHSLKALQRLFEIVTPKLFTAHPLLGHFVNAFLSFTPALIAEAENVN